MALKVYRSNSIPGFRVKINGVSKAIHFRSYSDGGGYYTTKDEEEQKVIESDSWFASGKIYIDQVKETAPEVKVTETKTEDAPIKRIVEGITKCAQAREWIEQNLGVECSPVMSRAKIFEIADLYNVEFPDLPKENKK